MLTNLVITHPVREGVDGMALAIGEKYRFDQVLEAAMRFLRGFASDALSSHPKARPFARHLGEDIPLDEKGYVWFAQHWNSLAEEYDVFGDSVSITIGPYLVTCRLLGTTSLFFQEKSGLLTTCWGDAWERLETAPEMQIHTSDPERPFFSGVERAQAADLIGRHAAAVGLQVVEKVRGLWCARFLRALDGCKPLRIAVNAASDQDD